MMIGREKTQVWANVPKPMKRRLGALKKYDPVAFSESRVIWKALEEYVPKLEEQVNFNAPTQPAPRTRRRST